MARHDEFAFMDAIAQAELVRHKKVTPIELVDAAIERIERLNPALNAVVTRMYEQARAAAMSTLPAGPFTGVPFLLKDLIVCCRGTRSTWGSAFLRDFVPDRDSELVVRLKRAGLVILGMTNTPEFGLRPTTEPRLFGPCHNPWDTARSPGGSSGGSAAAVAAGLVPMAHGNDAGGSIRIPASCCGVFGMKPTRGRNPLDPDHVHMLGALLVEHAITRSVRDSAALLDATAGADIGDPYWAPPPKRPFLQEVGAAPGKLNIAFTTAVPPFSYPDSGSISVHADCVTAVCDAVQLCEELGHHLEEAMPAVDGEQVASAAGNVLLAGTASAIDRFASLTGRTVTPEQFEPLNRTLYEIGRTQSLSDFLSSLAVLQRASRNIDRFFSKYDVWLTPTLTTLPMPLGAFDSASEDPWQAIVRQGECASFTGVANFTGRPAMSVPLFWNRENLPVGTQFVGRYGDEATLFRLAAQLEQARPWASRRPAISA
ncbi:MAG: amidase [Chloroflexi bacterium]|nr:amidase [Chloroflexota bacterium]